VLGTFSARAPSHMTPFRVVREPELGTRYWQLGEYISRKIASAEWGVCVVDELAITLGRRFAGLRGFAR
jgi:hypothetical protein